MENILDKALSAEPTENLGLRRKTEAEKNKLVQDAREESKIYRFSKISWRNLKGNKDILVLIFIILSMFFAGYLFCRITLGMSHGEIQIEITHFIELVFAIVTCISAAIVKLGMQKGLIARALNEKFESFEKDVDKKNINNVGVTIIKE